MKARGRHTCRTWATLLPLNSDPEPAGASGSAGSQAGRPSTRPIWRLHVPAGARPVPAPGCTCREGPRPCRPLGRPPPGAGVITGPAGSVVSRGLSCAGAAGGSAGHPGLPEGHRGAPRRQGDHLPGRAAAAGGRQAAVRLGLAGDAEPRHPEGTSLCGARLCALTCVWAGLRREGGWACPLLGFLHPWGACASQTPDFPLVSLSRANRHVVHPQVVISGVGLGGSPRAWY